MQNEDGHVQSAAPATETATRLKATQKYCACHISRLSSLTKHVYMLRGAVPATQHKTTRRLKPLKVTPFAKLTIVTAIATSRRQLQTIARVADA